MFELNLNQVSQTSYRPKVCTTVTALAPLQLDVTHKLFNYTKHFFFCPQRFQLPQQAVCERMPFLIFMDFPSYYQHKEEGLLGIDIEKKILKLALKRF